MQSHLTISGTSISHMVTKGSIYGRQANIEQNRYVESVHDYYYREVKDGKVVYAGESTREEVLDGLIGLLGYPGEWR